MDLGLKNKNVLVTASTSGIGFRTSECFLKEGANVVLCGRNGEKLNSAIEKLNNAYPNGIVKGLAADLTNKGDVINLKNAVRSELGYIDILVSNLGSGKPECKNPYDINEWRRLFDINLFSAVYVMESFLDTFTSEGGCIVFMSSLAGKNRINCPPAYAAAKSSINMLTKFAARDLSSKKIRVNAISPGNVKFEGGRWEEIIKIDPSVIPEYIEKEVPMKRLGTPEEIANAVVFLCSDKASYITGEILDIDGGQSKN